MKRLIVYILCISFCLCTVGCVQPNQGEIVATTLPVYEFTHRICQGTELTVSRLITEDVSCLHDYTLKVSQMQALENAKMIIISGAGLEDFLSDALGNDSRVLDASSGIELLCSSHTDHDHDHAHHEEYDPHIWLSVANAKQMANNIYGYLCHQYPQYQSIFEKNMFSLDAELSQLDAYAVETLSSLSNNKLITFHDGFGYLAEAYGLQIVHALEEESGAEASAQELIQLIQIVKEHNLTAVFTETNGSTSAASVISKEADIPIYSLDMAMSADSYFDAMYHNINTLKEALQ